MPDNTNWIMCPVCGGKTRLKVSPDTVIRALPLFCPKCKARSTINVRNQRIEF